MEVVTQHTTVLDEPHLPARPLTPLTDRRAWQDAALLWLATRLLFVVLTYLGRTLFAIPPYSQQRIAWGALFAP